MAGTNEMAQSRNGYGTLATGERVCFRFQPAGLPIVGHTSVSSSDDELPEGYVYCEVSVHSLGQCRAEGIPCGETDELVIFAGEDVYDPGDVHGFAVWPVRELARVNAAEWWARRERFGK